MMTDQGRYSNDLLDGSADVVANLSGDEGNDTIRGGSHTNNLSGGADDDIIYGNGSEVNFLSGDDGNDTLFGGPGNNYIEGGADDDWLYGGKGNNEISGGSGNDVLCALSGRNNTFEDSSGFDKYYISKGSATITDDDGSGQVFARGRLLTGGKKSKDQEGVWYNQSSGEYYLWDGEDGDLEIQSSVLIVVTNFSNGDLQINLEDEEIETPRDDVKRGTKTLSPIILDLDGDGVETTNISSGTFFDHDANGLAELTGWVSADDGLLVLDRDKNGTIDSGRELFGNATLLNDGTKAANGFQALAELDDNQDGRIDANDTAYTQLRIWQDADGDGYSSADELKTLTELDIQSIRTGYTETINNITDASGKIISLTALAGLDFNNDGRIDADDTTYTQLRIWQDLNGDGYLSGDELKTLSELDIKFINTEITNHITDASGKILSLKELARTDNNYDGIINSKDYRYTELRIWNDINWDGNVSVDELKPLSGRVIDYVNKGSVEDNTYAIDANGNIIKEYGTFTRADGTTGSAADVWFNVDKMYTVATEWLDVSEEIAALPNLGGTGNVYDLHQSMVRDESGHLKNLVEQFAVATDASVRHALVKQILYAWTGVENIDPLSRASGIFYGNAIGDARKLATLEAFIGEPYWGTWCGLSRDPNPHGKAVKYLLKAFDDLVARTYSQLMAQTHFKSLMDSITKTWNNDTNQYDWDVSATKDALQVLYLADPNNAPLAMREFSDILYLDGAGGRQALQELRAQGDVTSSDAFLRLLAEMGMNAIVGDGNGNYLQGANDDDFIYGMGGNDRLYGNDGYDVLNGGTGNDYLYGGTGNDTLDGGPGNDQLYGEAGNDTYIFGRGYGADSIYDYDKTPGNEDIIFLRSGISPADVSLRKSGNDLLLSIKDTTDSLTIRNWFSDEAGAYQVENIQFADGTLWDAAEIRHTVLQGTPGNDNLIGFSTADTIRGFEGDDKLYGRSGDDTIEGGPGNDSLYGEAGNDLLLGGDDMDYLSGGAGDDTLEGGSGNDSLYGEAGNDLLVGGDDRDYLSGGEGDDTLDGGLGNDRLYGEAGNDTYLFGRGYGEDYVSDYDKTPGNVDVILLNSDISPSDITLNRDYDNLVLTINGTTDKLTMGNWFSDEAGSYQVEHIQFANGTLWDAETIKQLILQGTPGNDLIIGYSSADLIRGLAGNDEIYGRDGDDTLEGGSGYDSLFGEAGNDFLTGGDEGVDYLSGGEGDDTLVGGTGNDTLYGEAGNDLLVGGDDRDYLSGGEGDDTLDGGPGNDSLYGEAGNDTYIFGRGYGEDYISDYDNTPGNLDTILLNSDIAPDDVTLCRDHDDLVLIINGTTDKLTIGKWFWNEAGAYQVEHIQFADGTLWDAETIKQMILIGTPGDDVLTGYSSDDIIRGLAGNDILYGRAGDDNIDGGPGNDSLYGEAGNDTYLFGRGSGQDIIDDFDNTAGNLDAILLDTGLLPEDITLRRIADDLVLSINDTSDTLTVNKWFLNESPDNQVEQIQFDDGTIWDVDAIKQIVIQGTPGDDLLIGYSSGDVLDGGAGNDTLIGNKGNDVYTFGRGYGQDKAIDIDSTLGNIDIVQLAPDVFPEDISLTWGPEGLYLTINGTSDSLLLSSWFVSDSCKIECIQFDDGTIWDTAMMQNIAGTPTYIETQLTGTPDNDVLIGNATSDFIQGMDGNDRLYGGVGNDIIFGGNGRDALYGGYGDDILDGGYWDDYLYGGSNTDYLDSSNSNGNDTYMFGYGSGQDVIIDYDKTPGNLDTILLNADITPADVILKRKNYDGVNDLVISLNGSSDTLTVKHWFLNNENKVEHIQFADGTVWDVPAIEQFVLQGMSYGDTLVGYSTSDTIMGYNGDDELYGRGGDDLIGGGSFYDELNGDDGNDTLMGGDGVDSWSQDYDTLYGGAGDDVLDGGAGYDTLYGGSKGNWYLQSGTNGNDTYLFGSGSGNDLVYDYDEVPGNLDTILLKRWH